MVDARPGSWRFVLVTKVKKLIYLKEQREKKKRILCWSYVNRQWICMFLVMPLLMGCFVGFFLNVLFKRHWSNQHSQANSKGTIYPKIRNRYINSILFWKKIVREIISFLIRIYGITMTNHKETVQITESDVHIPKIQQDN